MSPRNPRLSAGVVVVRPSEEGWRFLLLRAFNHWDFPKGMVEAGEQPLEAAIREVQEESLIEDLEFRWGESSTRDRPVQPRQGRLLLHRRDPHVRSLVADESRARPSRAQRVPLGRVR
jgi:hypothetical protein